MVLKMYNPLMMAMYAVHRRFGPNPEDLKLCGECQGTTMLNVR